MITLPPQVWCNNISLSGIRLTLRLLCIQKSQTMMMYQAQAQGTLITVLMRAACAIPGGGAWLLVELGIIILVLFYVVIQVVQVILILNTSISAYNYTLDIRTSSLDTVNAILDCPNHLVCSSQHLVVTNKDYHLQFEDGPVKSVKYYSDNFVILHWLRWIIFIKP